MDYNEFWNLDKGGQGSGPVKENAVPRGRAAYGAAFFLWCAWMLYLSSWATMSLAEALDSPLVAALWDAGLPLLAAWWLMAGLYLYGLAIWAFLGAALLRAACAAIDAATGQKRSGARRLKILERIWLGLCLLTCADVAACCSLLLSGLGALVQDSTGAGPLVAVIGGPFLLLGCFLACAGSMAMAALSVPMVRAIVKWAGMALDGAKGR